MLLAVRRLVQVLVQVLVLLLVLVLVLVSVVVLVVVVLAEVLAVAVVHSLMLMSVLCLLQVVVPWAETGVMWLRDLRQYWCWVCSAMVVFSVVRKRLVVVVAVGTAATRRQSRKRTCLQCHDPIALPHPLACLSLCSPCHSRDPRLGR